MSTQETIALLRRIRERLSDPARWTKRASAKMANGISCDFNNADAVCWCLTGAAHYEMPGRENSRLRRFAYRELIPGPDPAHNVITFNDNPDTTHADVLAKIDGAIERLATS
jgi:hypothetical protein